MINDCILPRKKNLGLSRCNKLPALPKMFIWTPNSFFFTPEQTSTAALFKVAIQNALLAAIDVRIFLWPKAVSFENISTPAVFEDTPLAYLAVRDGDYRFRFGFKQNMCWHKAAFTHRTNEGRIFIIDVENQMTGTVDEDGNFYGLTNQMLHTEKLLFSDGTVSTKSPIIVALADNTELDQNGAMANVPFINQLDRLTDVEITVVSAESDVIVVDVKQECDGTPVSGLVTADFLKYDADGVLEALVAVAGTGDLVGRYTLTATVAFTDGTLDLRSPALLTVKAYEAEAVEIDVA